jgi:hypothetical protein
MSYQFKHQQRVGRLGEIIFKHAHSPSDYIEADGRKGDFILYGNKSELKTDTYGMDETPNFFFERFSNISKQTPGGPWQSFQHDSVRFIYFYLPSLTFFTFKTEGLMKWLNTNASKYTSKTITNSSHQTLGYLIPREAVKHLYRESKILLTTRSAIDSLLEEVGTKK